MKLPTVFSIFLSGILLPDIVLSKTTSSLPEYFCKAIEKAHSKTVLAETRVSFANCSML